MSFDSVSEWKLAGRRRLGRPWELGAFLVLHDHAPSVLRDGLPLVVDKDQRWNAADAVLALQLAAFVALAERQGKEGHLRVVFLKGHLVSVRGHEHNLEFLASSSDFLVGLAQHGGETAARGAPVGREVDANHIGIVDAIVGYWAFLAKKLNITEKSSTSHDLIRLTKFEDNNIQANKSDDERSTQ